MHLGTKYYFIRLDTRHGQYRAGYDLFQDQPNFARSCSKSALVMALYRQHLGVRGYQYLATPCKQILPWIHTLSMGYHDPWEFPETYLDLPETLICLQTILLPKGAYKGRINNLSQLYAHLSIHDSYVPKLLRSKNLASIDMLNLVSAKLDLDCLRQLRYLRLKYQRIRRVGVPVPVCLEILCLQDSETAGVINKPGLRLTDHGLGKYMRIGSIATMAGGNEGLYISINHKPGLRYSTTGLKTTEIKAIAYAGLLRVPVCMGIIRKENIERYKLRSWTCYKMHPPTTVVRTAQDI